MASYLGEVKKTGDPLVVCRYNKPIAVIMPPKKVSLEDDFDRFFGFMGKGGETGVEFVNRVRRNKREREYVKRLRRGIT